MNLPKAMLNDDGEGAVAPSPKLKLRKPIVVPKASLGSSLDEAVSDDSLSTGANSSLEIDLPALPAPTASAADIKEANSLPEDLVPLGDLDSLSTSSTTVSRPNISMEFPLVSRSRSLLHKVPMAALSLGPSLGETMSSSDSSLPEQKTKSGTNGGVVEPAAIEDSSNETADAQDSFLDEELDEPLQSPRQRPVERAKKDASVLHALDSEVQKGTAASIAEINAVEAESEAGASDVVLPTVPLWGVPQTHGI